jgi:hypothetical protein
VVHPVTGAAFTAIPNGPTLLLQAQGWIGGPPVIPGDTYLVQVPEEGGAVLNILRAFEATEVIRRD